MTSDAGPVLDQVLSKITPTEEERAHLHKVATEVIAHAKFSITQRNLDADAILIGSAARDTWVSGDRDIDVFIGFASNVSREDLQIYGLEIGKDVARGSYVIQYAEHPYVKANIDGFHVDIVPYYVVDDASKIISAVDRTPFHQQFVSAHLNHRENEVRVLKQFLKGIGVYGAELKIKGFSGYLSELLIIKYGSFMHLLRAAAKWRFGQLVDVTNGGARTTFTSPLIVIDPVDTKRNVAAAVSTDSFSIFVDAAREFLRHPCLHIFFPPSMDPITTRDLQNILTRRGTKIYALKFQLPELVEDIVYPQLEKSLKGILDGLAREEFLPLRGDIYYDGRHAVLLFELLVWHLAPIIKHIGPPLDNSEHATKFKDIYMNNPLVISGPYVEDGHYIVELPRKYVSVESFIRKELGNLKLSRAVYRAVRSGFTLLCNGDIINYDDHHYCEFLARYFRRSLPNC